MARYYMGNRLDDGNVLGGSDPVQNADPFQPLGRILNKPGYRKVTDREPFTNLSFPDPINVSQDPFVRPVKSSQSQQTSFGTDPFAGVFDRVMDQGINANPRDLYAFNLASGGSLGLGIPGDSQNPLNSLAMLLLRAIARVDHPLYRTHLGFV